jgi:hypothetical protein
MNVVGGETNLIPLYYETRSSIIYVTLEVEGKPGHYRYPILAKKSGIGRVDVPVILGEGGRHESTTVSFSLQQSDGLVSDNVLVKLHGF